MPVRRRRARPPDREREERVPDDLRGRDAEPSPDDAAGQHGVWVLERRTRRRSSRRPLLALSSPPRTVRARPAPHSEDEPDEDEEAPQSGRTNLVWILVCLAIGLALVIRPAIDFILRMLGPIAQPGQ